eukprot:m.538286 g.538286  ORF g.538286 m.538286 type:complete len:109 (-) comp22081_c0_seq2:3268-3594(-)
MKTSFATKVRAQVQPLCPPQSTYKEMKKEIFAFYNHTTEEIPNDFPGVVMAEACLYFACVSASFPLCINGVYGFRYNLSASDDDTTVMDDSTIAMPATQGGSILLVSG